LAKLDAPENAETRREFDTRPGAVIGTVGYMSPEQVKGQPADARSDIFSLGTVLYEMVSGRRAFEAETNVETMMRIVREDPPPLQAGAGLQRLILRCLEKLPEERFQSARDLGFAMQSLAAAGESEALGVSPVSVKARRTPWPGLVAATLAAALAATAVLAFAAGFWIRARREAPAERWTGVRLGGPGVAFSPKISPDGKLLAFMVYEDRQSQVAVMDPDTGNWTPLTHDRANGIVLSMCWSRDSSRIYFDRRTSAPTGIFSVSALGGEVQTVLENAAQPAVLPDGSLLAVQLNAKREYQLQHFWPETGRLEALGAEVALAFGPHLAAFHDGRAAAFFGRPISSAGPRPPLSYYVVDLSSGGVRPLAPGLTVPDGFGALAIAPGDQSVIVLNRSGDLHEVVEASRSGIGPVRTRVSLQGEVWGLDVGPDGSIYVDAVQRPSNILRFAASGGVPEKLPGGGDEGTGIGQLPDGRILVVSILAGRSRLMAARPGKEPAPFVQTGEQTGSPFAVVGDREVAFAMGTAPNRTLAVASASDGRMIRRLPATKDLGISSLAASPDGSTLYYVVSGTIWAIPAAGGDPRKIASGDEVAADPSGRELIVARTEKEGSRLVRISLSGGAETPISFPSGLHLIPGLTPNAVHRDARILVPVQSQDSWWDEVAILEPKTGKLDRLDIPYAGDIDYPSWSGDGRMIAIGLPMQSSLWRFRKEKQ
jgi:hypothetical protein